MRLDGLRAHAEIESDRLVRPAGENTFEHAPLPRAERWKDAGCLAWPKRRRRGATLDLRTIHLCPDQPGDSGERFTSSLQIGRSLTKLFTLELHGAHAFAELGAQAAHGRKN